MNILLHLSIYLSLYNSFTNTGGFILPRKLFSHFLLVEDFISCTCLKIHRLKKKICMQQFTTMRGLPLHTLSVLKLHQQWKTAHAAFITDLH